MAKKTPPENVVSLVAKADKAIDKYQEELLDVALNFYDMVKDKQVKEFVISYVTDDGDILISTCCKDLVGGVGLFELGKSALLNQP